MNLKDGLLPSKRPQIATQKAAFYKLKGGLLERHWKSITYKGAD